MLIELAHQRIGRRRVESGPGELVEGGDDADVRDIRGVLAADGEKLTELMIDYGIGVTNVANYTVKKIDPDYFGVD